GEHDAHRVRLLVRGQGLEEAVDGSERPPILAGRHGEDAPAKGRAEVRRSDVGVTGTQALAVPGGMEGEPGLAGQDLGQEAGLTGIQMLDEDESDGDGFGEGAEELLE